MSRRGRPRKTRPSVRIVLSGWLDAESDADIIAWLQAVPKGQRMNALKTALRSGGLGLAQNPGDSLQDEVKNAAEEFLNHWEF
jgi:hypothetical protein